jgi:NADH-quinone oxidoreductase subunit J
VEPAEVIVAILFWIFSALMLGFACAVVFSRNPVASALSLAASFVSLAAIFIFTLDAYFLGVIQILVYAGAVMVLFLFIIMLLDIKVEERRKLNAGIIAGGLVVATAFVIELCSVIGALPIGIARSFPARTFPPLHDRLDDVGNVGRVLFSGYNLPFQVVGVLLLVATVGVVILSKRELK